MQHYTEMVSLDFAEGGGWRAPGSTEQDACIILGFSSFLIPCYHTLVPTTEKICRQADLREQRTALAHRLVGISAVEVIATKNIFRKRIVMSRINTLLLVWGILLE